MVQCAAFNCNVTSGKGVSMFLFPKDPKLRKIWVERMKRDGFQPSKYSKLCERHFEKDQFTVNPDVIQSIGYALKTRKDLLDSAVPSLFDFGPVTSTPLKRSAPRKSMAHEKRQRLQIIGELLQNDQTEILQDLETTGNCEDVADTTHAMPQEMEVVANTSVVAKETFSSGTQTTYGIVKRRHVKLQTDIVERHMKLEMRNQGTQTDSSHVTPPENNGLNDSFLSFNDDIADPDWEPDSSDEEDIDETDDINPATERKFIVYESCLDKLLETCSRCGSVCQRRKKIIGSFLRVTIICDRCNHSDDWESQPLSGTMPYGNLIIAGAILFSGSSPSKVVTMLNHAAICSISLCTYMKIQSLYLVPTITSVWQSKIQELFSQLRDAGNPLVLGGDGRCCSPGHTAKYLTYSLMELNSTKILDIQLVQSNEVKNSYAMELEGLKRCLETLDEEQLQISHLVTDRHCQIKKFMKNERRDVQHWFDCWHVAKGVYKKLEAAGKKKSCEIIGAWARSISNHIYWCAMSSDGDGKLVLEKWLSILNHVVNIHQGHGQHFVQCEHDIIDDRAWLKKDSKSYAALEKIVRGRLLLTDIQKLSPAQQTSGLEAFHKVVCHFAPKLVHFFHAQMEARVYLAALHFNENSQRRQAIGRDGEARFVVSYPKARKGEGVAKEVKVQATYDYVAELFEDLLIRREVNSSFTKAKTANAIEDRARPLPISKTCDHLTKEEIVFAHRSRFNT